MKRKSFMRFGFLLILGLPVQDIHAYPAFHSELVSFSVTPAEGGASGFVIAVAVR